MQPYEKLYLNLDFQKRIDLDYEVLDKLSKLLRTAYNKDDIRPSDCRNDLYWPGDEFSASDVSQFFTLGNSINFRYWQIDKNGSHNYCQGIKGGIHARGAMYMWRCL